MLEEIAKEKDMHLDNDSHNNGKRKSLGRGLGALLGDEGLDLDDFSPKEQSEENHHTNKADIQLIDISPFQPRTEFDEEALQALADSIKEKGVLQPLLVRKNKERYELIAGERRLRASKIAGLKEVPIIVKEMSDQEVLEVALVENLLRENLSAIEEAEGLQRLINEFSHTQEALSKIIGKSRSHIANTLRLLDLPESIKNMIKEGKLSAGHARNLVGLENAEEIAQIIIKKDLNVRQVEELISKIKKGPAETKEPKTINPDIVDIEKSLNKILGLKIKINQGKQGSGKVILQYASIAELDMIIDLLEQKRKNPQTIALKTQEEEPKKEEKFTMKIID